MASLCRDEVALMQLWAGQLEAFHGKIRSGEGPIFDVVGLTARTKCAQRLCVKVKSGFDRRTAMPDFEIDLRVIGTLWA